jgi:hypothetical protein
MQLVRQLLGRTFRPMTIYSRGVVGSSVAVAMLLKFRVSRLWQECRQRDNRSKPLLVVSFCSVWKVRGWCEAASFQHPIPFFSISEKTLIRSHTFNNTHERFCAKSEGQDPTTNSLTTRDTVHCILVLALHHDAASCGPSLSLSMRLFVVGSVLDVL